MANEQNLKPFQKGNPGGPGRPKKLPDLDRLLADVLGEEATEDGISEAQKVLAKLKDKALEGDVRAAEVLLDRAYGKAKQNMEVVASVDMNTQTTVTDLSDEDLLKLAEIQSKIK